MRDISRHPLFVPLDAELTADGGFVFHPERPFDEEVARYVAFDPTVDEASARRILSGLEQVWVDRQRFYDALNRGETVGDVEHEGVEDDGYSMLDYTEEDEAADRAIAEQLKQERLARTS